MPPSLSHIRAEIGSLVAAVQKAWRREADQALSDHGLSWATAIPLTVLSRRGNSLRQGALADELGIEGPSLVPLLNLLQAEGLVERREDETDRRAKTLHLTPLGEAKANEINRVLHRVRVSLLKDVSYEDLVVTFETLQRIERQAKRRREAKTEPAAK